MATVLIHETTGVDRSAEPVLGGVPVPRGELKGGGWFELRNEAGKAFTVEGSPAAWWPDGSVKWLHLCGLADVAGGEANRFVLAPAESAPGCVLTVERDTDYECVIRGGALEVRVRGDVLKMLGVTDVATGRELLVPPGISFAYQLADVEQQGWRPCRFELTRELLEPVVETANRVVVRLAGHLLDKGAREVALVRLFVEVWRETREIRLQPVLIPVGLPNEEMIRRFALRVHTPIRDGAREVVFGDEQGKGFRDVVDPYPPFGPRWPEFRQVQLGSSFYVTEKRTCQEAGWVKAVEGQRAQGWCHLAGEQGGVTAAMRYFWQEYPHSLEVNADDGTMTFGMIPNAAPPLDLRRYSPTIYGGGAPDVFMYETGDGPDEPRLSGARGIAKAHELAIQFHEAGEGDVARSTLGFLRPCRPTPAPEDFAASHAVGQVAPFGAAGENVAEATVARTMDFILAERAFRGWYGLMNFGDVEMGYYTEPDRWAFDDGGHAWLNTEHLPDYGMWLASLCAARPDWLEASIEMTRHNRDVDMYHWGPLMGLGSRHNVNHWGCRDKEWRVSMPITKRLHYYLTADPWTREVILRTVGVYQSYTDRTGKHAPGFTAALAGLLVKWELTGAAADGDVVRNMADLYASAMREDGRFSHQLRVDFSTGKGEPVGDEAAPDFSFFMDGFGGQHVLVEIAELIGHGPLADALLRHAEFRLQPPTAERSSGPEQAVEFMAHAWRRTGDARFRDAIAGALEHVSLETEWIGGDGLLDEPPHQRACNQTRRNKYMCQLGKPLTHVPFALAALVEGRPDGGTGAE